MQEIKDSKLHNVFILNLDEASRRIFAKNPALANCMEENKHLLKNMPFFLVNYPFAANIIYNGQVNLPLVNNGNISVNDTSLPEIIRNNLSYSPGIDNPVGILLNKDSEFYLPSDERIVSYPVIKAGQIFGFAHIIDAVMNKNVTTTHKKAKASIWNLNAGARTTFILSKISENGSHTNLLKAYRIKIDKPNTYVEHNNVFSMLNTSIDKPWTQSILYFPKQFLEKLKTDNQFSKIYQEMANIHRSGYTIWHTDYAKFESDISYIFQKTNANSFSAYAVNIAKHIYIIIAGGVPGFAPAVNENMLPKKLIEDAYSKEDGYALTEYWPIIMQPQQFNNKEAIYYSLNLPTLINYNPEAFAGKTSIALLVEVATILCRCQKYILNEFKDQESVLYETAVKAQFSFYHDTPNPEKYGDMIKSSSLLPEEDPRFYKKGWNFPFKSQFVRGCIKIEPKKLT